MEGRVFIFEMSGFRKDPPTAELTETTMSLSEWATFQADAKLGRMLKELLSGLAIFHNADLPLWIGDDRAEWAIVEIEHEMDVNVLRIGHTLDVLQGVSDDGS